MKKGFTLIELLVVLAIIGILAAMIIASLSGARARARDAARKSDLAQVKTALETYYNDKEAYPPDLTWAGLETTLEATPIYMGTVPYDPLNTGSYVYSYTPSGSPVSSYTMCAVLEKGASGGNWKVTPDVTQEGAACP